MNLSHVAAYLFLGGISVTPTIPASPGHFAIFDVQGAGTQSGQGTFADSLNAVSSVTGYYFDSSFFEHGFVRAPDGAITTFDASSAGLTQPMAINRKGIVGGFYLRPKTEMGFKGFLRNNNGGLQRISAGGVSTSVYALTDKGEAVGTYATKNRHIIGYFRASDGTITHFQDPKAGAGRLEGTFPFGANNAGLIVGQYENKRGAGGFIRNADGTFTNFNVSGAGGALGTDPIAINKAGTVTGLYTDTNDVYHAFIRDPAGTIITFDAPGAGTDAFQGTQAVSIADDGTVAGSYFDGNNVSHGYLRSKDGTIKEFDAPGTGTGGGDGTFTNSINELHEIAGFEVDNNGVSHGFLRTP